MHNHRVWVALVGLLALPMTGWAQSGFFPRVEPFEYPLAAHRASGVTGRLIRESRGESLFGPEQEADVSIGENVPVVRLGSGSRPAFLGLTIRVLGRFSLDDSKSALLSNDWVAGTHLVIDRGPWRLVGELFHESSHLGDEYVERFGANVRRVDWTREAVALSVRRMVGRIAVHAVGSVNLTDELALPRTSLGLGVDYRGRGRTVRPVLGVYGESAAYGGWKVTTSARGSMEFAGPGGVMSVGLVYLNGLSQQRQFFRRQSRYVGFELRFDW